MRKSNITAITYHKLSDSTDEIIHQITSYLPDLPQRKKIEDVYFIENIISDSQITAQFMQEIVDRLYVMGFDRVKIHTLTEFCSLLHDTKLHIDLVPISDKKPFALNHPSYINVFALDGETSNEYQEAMSLYDQEKLKNSGVISKSIELVAIEEYIAKIKYFALNIFKRKSFIEVFNLPQNTFIANETEQQRKLRVMQSLNNKNDNNEKERQVVTGLIAKRIAQLEIHLKYMHGYQKPNNAKLSNQSRIMNKLKSFFLTNFLPKSKRIIKKQPQKLLADLRILNALLDHVDAKLWRQIIKQNLFLFECANDFPDVFKTTFSLLKYLYKGKFSKADTILEKCEKTTLAVAAAMPIAHARALMQNDDLIEFVGRI